MEYFRKLIIFTVIIGSVHTLTGCGGSQSYTSDVITGDTSTDANSVDSGVSTGNTSENSIPVANAGVDQNVATNSLVKLDASQSSDADNEQINFMWEIKTKPNSSLSKLNNSTSPSPTFTPDIDGDYIVTLVVSDGSSNSVADEVTIISSLSNSMPVANAGDDQNKSIHNGTFEEVILDGSLSSDADNDDLTYAWSIESAPAGTLAALTDSTVVNPKFSPDLEGNYVLSLVVYDGLLFSEAATVSIKCSIYNSAPQANIDAEKETFFELTEIQLSGSNSVDDDSDPLSYQWQVKSKPITSSVDLAGATSENITFTPDQYGDYVVSLKVNDGFVDGVDDTIIISIKTESEKGDYLRDNLFTYTSTKSVSSFNGYARSGSQFGFTIQNNNTETLNWDKLEVLDANGTTVISSTDSNLLGSDGALTAGESNSLSITLQQSHLLPLMARYYLSESTNAEISIVKSHRL